MIAGKTRWRYVDLSIADMPKAVRLLPNGEKIEVTYNEEYDFGEDLNSPYAITGILEVTLKMYPEKCVTEGVLKRKRTTAHNNSYIIKYEGKSYEVIQEIPFQFDEEREFDLANIVNKDEYTLVCICIPDKSTIVEHMIPLEISEEIN